MQLVRDLTDLPASPPSHTGGVLCVGNFDGVHCGHVAMLTQGRQLATAKGQPFFIMTFDPHPTSILFPNRPLSAIMTPDQRLEALGQFAPDTIILVKTTPQFLAMTALDFLTQIVRGRLGVTHMVEGANFTFGQRAQGTAETLRTQGPDLGIGCTLIDTQVQTLSDLTQVNVSSTLIRWLIAQGRVVDAGRCLGHPVTLRGQIVPGQRRGRTLGFPTANLHTSQLPPAPGVYAGHAKLAGQRYQAAISVGASVTFENTQGGATVEAHLLDYPRPSSPPVSGVALELYGQTMDLGFDRWLREMQRFGGPHQLRRQLQLDVAATRSVSPLHEEIQKLQPETQLKDQP